MGKPFARGSKLWHSYKDPTTQKWVNKPTGFNVGQDAEAQRYIDTFEERLALGAAALGPMTVTVFAEEWLAKRTNASADDDRTRLRKHVLPRIGSMHLAAVKPRHLDDLIEELKAEGALAPRTIRQISGLLHTMFKRAVKEERIATNPVIMERGTLPKKVDKDPTWRSEAIFTRAETESLISDARILPDRRVLYALKFLAGGMRHGEASSLRWRQYDADAQPLGRLALGKTKSGVPREIPVHPTLAKVLAAWKLSGWEAVYGRKPTSDDLIVPTRIMTARDASDAQVSFCEDLARLGFRVKAGQAGQNRRGHDLRRTFITLARTDGAIDSLLRWITHGPSSDMLDLYSTPPWHSLCAEISKLKIELREGLLVELPAALLTASLQREASARKRWRKVATPTGFEPVLPA